ncbi:MAG: DUF4230 domain-containing protein [Bacteroidaceae bacterium]|nr:DUF4230 domain-containing protein [Bacteroidaceae bacterium]
MQKIRSFLQFLFTLACIVLLVWAFTLARQWGQGEAMPSLFSFRLGGKKGIGPTPAQLRSIERIGKWEFLSIEDEEIVDTVRHRLLLPDQHLVRIYRGTLSLGIDLSMAQQDWVRMQSDTVVVTLPQVTLLNPQFIDEASTRTFHETGTWDAQAREQMYQKARRVMMDRCLSEENLRMAQETGKAHMKAVFRNLGFENVVVE